jgi:hypothetical protein
MRREANTLDPICLHCVVPRQPPVAGHPRGMSLKRLLSRAECPRCGRTVAVRLKARVVRAGDRGPTPPRQGLEPSRSRLRGVCHVSHSHFQAPC